MKNQQNTNKQILQHVNNITHHDQVGFIPGIQGNSALKKKKKESLFVIHYLNRTKEKKDP